MRRTDYKWTRRPHGSDQDIMRATFKLGARAAITRDGAAKADADAGAEAQQHVAEANETGGHCEPPLRSLAAKDGDGWEREGGHTREKQHLIPMCSGQKWRYGGDGGVSQESGTRACIAQSGLTGCAHLKGEATREGPQESERPRWLANCKQRWVARPAPERQEREWRRPRLWRRRWECQCSMREVVRGLARPIVPVEWETGALVHCNPPICRKQHVDWRSAVAERLGRLGERLGSAWR